jgi:protein gp37
LVFVNSMSDLFHADVPDEFIARVWAVMAATPQHTYQVLTKRHGRMRSLLNRGTVGTAGFFDDVEQAMAEFTHAEPSGWPLPNVWLGCSVEDQKRADLRIPALLETPAAVRFLSCEPLLGPVSLARPDGEVNQGFRGGRCGAAPGSCGDNTCRTGIDWVIAGGESGPGARPMHPDWARSLRDQCTAAGVPFFFKQWGEWVHRKDSVELVRVGKKQAGRELDGRVWDEYPAGLVRS